MGLLCWKMLNKLRRYPQQPQCFIVTNLSEACCKAKRWKPCWTCWNLTWPCTKDSQNLLRDLLCNLLQNPLNLTWLCTKASWNLLRNLLRNPDLALHQSLPDLLRNLSRNLLRIPVEPDLAAPKPPSPSPEPSPEPCWTWLGFAPTLPGTFSGTFFGTLLNLTWLCTKASQTFSGTFGTFSGTSWNLTWRLRQCTPEPFWAEDTISLRCWGKNASPAQWECQRICGIGMERRQGCSTCWNLRHASWKLGTLRTRLSLFDGPGFPFFCFHCLGRQFKAEWNDIIMYIYIYRIVCEYIRIYIYI